MFESVDSRTIVSGTELTYSVFEVTKYSKFVYFHNFMYWFENKQGKIFKGRYSYVRKNGIQYDGVSKFGFKIAIKRIKIYYIPYFHE